MTEMNEIVRLAIDTYKGVPTQYSQSQSLDTLNQAIVAANNGKTYLDIRDIRDGKCAGLFTLIETILNKTTIEGLQEDDYFNALVEIRNVAEGDKNIFEVEDVNMFTVADVANGTQALRRQRLNGTTQTTIDTTVKGIRIYEEMNRVLSGAVDFNKFIQKASASMRQRLLQDIYDLWIGAVAKDFGGTAFYNVGGSYSENVLLDMIGHVEASANGMPATILGTKKAIRKLAPSIVADSAKEDMYKTGHWANFYGTPVVATPQRHKVGSTQFVLADDVVHVIAGNEKPIKLVYEGDTLMHMGNPIDNMDLTNEFLLMQKWGLGLILAGNTGAGIGRYQFT